MSKQGDPRVLILVLGALSAFGSASLDMYLPALPTIAADFQVGAQVIQGTVGTFLLGFAAGMLVYGPLSDCFGRRPVIAAGIVVYVLASVACALAPDIDVLLAARLGQALGGGAAMALARAIVRDRFDADRGAATMSLMMLISMAVPLLAPLLGGVMLVGLGWRSIFWALALFALASLVALWALVPETLPPERRQPFHPGAVVVGYARIARDGRALGFLLCGGAAFGGMMAYVTGTPFAYIGYFGVRPEHYGLLFGLAAFANGLGALINSRRVGRLGYRAMLRQGSAIAGAAGILLLLEVPSGFPSLALLVAPLVFYVGSVSFTATNAVAGVMALYPRQAGAASALFGAAQFGLGALFNVAVGLLGDGTPRGLALVVGGAGLVSFAANRLLIGRAPPAT